jgi:hypothetical protein
MRHISDGAEVAKRERQREAQPTREHQRKEQWYWISFAKQWGFLGGAIVWGHDIKSAVLRAKELKIGRGFQGVVEVFCEPIPARVVKEHIPADLRNRLLSEHEVIERLNGYRVLGSN